ncbi:MAG: hypothetical protein ACRDK3_13105 [Actinomycetota bacterium]
MSSARIPGLPARSVAGTLEELTPDCAVRHDQSIGRRGARVDHIVVGPFGVLCVTVRHQRGRVTVTDKDCLVAGERLNVVPAARRDALAVGVRLEAASGLDCFPRAVIVMAGSQLTIEGRPDAVTVVTDDAFGLWLRSLPKALDEVQQRAFSSVMREPQTWSPRLRARRTRLFGGRSSGSTRSVDLMPKRASVKDWALFETWVRTGEHRFYVHDPDGRCLAYYDVTSGELVLASETVRSFAEAMLGPHMKSTPRILTDSTISHRPR